MAITGPMDTYPGLKSPTPAPAPGPATAPARGLAWYWYLLIVIFCILMVLGGYLMTKG